MPFRIQTRIILVTFIFLGFFIFSAQEIFAATFTVTKTADTNDGTCNADCSLREAIVAANANSGADEIDFNIPNSDGGFVAASGSTQAYWVVTVDTTTLTLSDNSGVFINGYSQTGSSRNTASFGQTDNAILTINVKMNNLSIIFFTLTGSNNHLAGLNLIGGNTATGINGTTGASNWIEGNFMGTDITGTTASSSLWGNIQFATNSNIIGTNGDANGDVGERNVIVFGTGNGGALTANSNSNIIAGNYLGVNKTGRACTAATENRHQIFISGNSNRVGTNYDNVSDSEESNTLGCINANLRAELRVDGVGNIIQGNYIGTTPQGDNLSTGIAEPGIQDSSGSTGAIIKGNVIAYNGSYGISYGAGSTNNTITQNKIYNNGFLDGKIEIDLNRDGINANDSGDTDTGANDLMNFPIITSAEYVGGSKYKLKGTMDYNHSEFPITIEIFASNDESSGHGGAVNYLGSVNPSPDGLWEVIVPNVLGQDGTRRVSFTATATNSLGSTSEFSQNFGTGGSSSVQSQSNTTCQENGPTTPPVLYNIIPQSSSSLKLYFSEPIGSYTRYFLEYGEKPNTYYYGNQYVASNPATTYIVKNLKPGTRYYFKIGAANGCAPGGWSSEKSAVTLKANPATQVTQFSNNTPVIPTQTSLPASKPAESPSKEKHCFLFICW